MNENVMIQQKYASKSIGATRNDMLKIIAMLTMLIDHIGLIFFPEEMIFRTIGRVAFPIFAYQISIGFRKTSNLREYFARMLRFGLISQIPYMFLNPDIKFNTDSFKLNVILYFCIGISMLYTYKHSMLSFKEFRENKSSEKLLKGVALLYITILIIVFPLFIEIAIEGITLSYGTYGLLMILIFYQIGDKVMPTVLAYIALSFLYPLAEIYIEVAAAVAESSSAIFGESYTFIQCLFLKHEKIWEFIGEFYSSFIYLNGLFFQSRSILALIPIYTLKAIPNKIKLNKYVGYVFYPAHIAGLVLIAFLIRNIF